MSLGGGMECFFCPPNEKVRVARSKKPDLEEPPRTGDSWDDEVVGCRTSSCPAPFKSVEEGAVEALLCREELSVDVALVVLETPLPLASPLAKRLLSSACQGR